MSVNFNPNFYVSPVSAPSVGGVRPVGDVAGADDPRNSEEIKQKKRLGAIECATCASRRYVDGSDDPGVSFKTPTKLEPNEAASKVVSHEMEHYTREAADAKENNREVVSNNIQIFTDVCPECGKTYVSGGKTTTVTKGKSEDEQRFEDLLGLNNEENDPNSVHNLNKSLANKAFGLNFDATG